MGRGCRARLVPAKALGYRRLPRTFHPLSTCDMWFIGGEAAATEPPKAQWTARISGRSIRSSASTERVHDSDTEATESTEVEGSPTEQPRPSGSPPFVRGKPGLKSVDIEEARTEIKRQREAAQRSKDTGSNKEARKSRDEADAAAARRNAARKAAERKEEEVWKRSQERRRAAAARAMAAAEHAAAQAKASREAAERMAAERAAEAEAQKEQAEREAAEAAKEAAAHRKMLAEKAAAVKAATEASKAAARAHKAEADVMAAELDVIRRRKAAQAAQAAAEKAAAAAAAAAAHAEEAAAEAAAAAEAKNGKKSRRNSARGTARGTAPSSPRVKVSPRTTAARAEAAAKAAAAKAAARAAAAGGRRGPPPRHPPPPRHDGSAWGGGVPPSGPSPRRRNPPPRSKGRPPSTPPPAPVHLTPQRRARAAVDKVRACLVGGDEAAAQSALSEASDLAIKTEPPLISREELADMRELIETVRLPSPPARTPATFHTARRVHSRALTVCAFRFAHHHPKCHPVWPCLLSLLRRCRHLHCTSSRIHGARSRPLASRGSRMLGRSTASTSGSCSRGTASSPSSCIPTDARTASRWRQCRCSTRAMSRSSRGASNVEPVVDMRYG